MVHNTQTSKGPNASFVARSPPLCTTATRSFPRSSTRSHPREEVRAERAVDVRREAEVRRVAVQVRQRARVFKRRAAKLQLRQTPGDHRVARRARERALRPGRGQRSPRGDRPCARPCATPPRLAARRARVPSRQHPAQGGTDDHPDHPSRSSRGGVRRPIARAASGTAGSARRRRRASSAVRDGGERRRRRARARARAARPRSGHPLPRHGDARGTFAASALGSCASTSTGAGGRRPGRRPGAGSQDAVAEGSRVPSVAQQPARPMIVAEPSSRGSSPGTRRHRIRRRRACSEQGRRNAGRADGARRRGGPRRPIFAFATAPHRRACETSRPSRCEAAGGAATSMACPHGDVSIATTAAPRRSFTNGRRADVLAVAAGRRDVRRVVIILRPG